MRQVPSPLMKHTSSMMLTSLSREALPLWALSCHRCINIRRSLDGVVYIKTFFSVRHKSTLDMLYVMLLISLPLIALSLGEWRSGLAWTLGFCVTIGGSVKDLKELLFG